MRQKTRKVLRLRQLRRAREMTQATLAEKVGLQTQSYCLIENGRPTSLATATKLAQVFGLPIEEVFALVEVPTHV